MGNTARISLLLVLVLGAPAANAGSIVTTVNGSSFASVSSGALISIDTVITFGPTVVGGFGAGFELSLDFDGGVGFGGATITPPDWFDLTGGSFVCAAGHCENIVSVANLGFGAAFPSGSSFALQTIVIDTTGLAPGLYAVGAGFTGPADGIFLDLGDIDLSGEYTITGAIFGIGIPEPGTALLLVSGLVGIAAFRRRREA